MLLVPIIFSLAACCPDLDKEKIKAMLNKELHVGDSREKIETVLKNNNIKFGYDGVYEHKYYSSIRSKNCFNPFDKSVDVEVYLDKSDLLSKININYSYTLP